MLLTKHIIVHICWAVCMFPRSSALLNNSKRDRNLYSECERERGACLRNFVVHAQDDCNNVNSKKNASSTEHSIACYGQTHKKYASIARAFYALCAHIVVVATVISFVCLCERGFEWRLCVCV